MTKWAKDVVSWVEDGIGYVSVPFTWSLPRAKEKCRALQELVEQVRAGGPAVSLMPSYLKDVAEVGGVVDAVRHHNPDATFTSRGCTRKCSFCAIPKIEGDLVELDAWEPKPIVCDNNLLACSKRHFDKVVDKLRGVKKVDFNQGLDARLLTDYHIDRMRELDIATVRFAWDDIKFESVVMDAIDKIEKAGFPKRKIHVYVLLGFKDTPEDALYRLQSLKDRGVWPNPQRFQPLNALEKDDYVSPSWTNKLLKRYMRYWSRQIWLWKIPFEEYIG